MKINTLWQDIDGVNKLRAMLDWKGGQRNLSRYINLAVAINDRRRRNGSRLCVSEKTIRALKHRWLVRAIAKRYGD